MLLMGNIYFCILIPKVNCRNSNVMFYKNRLTLSHFFLFNVHIYMQVLLYKAMCLCVKTSGKGTYICDSKNPDAEL